MISFAWKKKGLIYAPPKDKSWRDNTALTPTAFQHSEHVIRVYAGFRDPKGISRIGFVDVDSNNPSNILSISKHPVLDIGSDGMFDDSGVILGDVIRVNNKVYMYYVGFQLVEKVKFLAYTGLAISEDGGDTFQRASETPILDRANEGLYIRAIHSVMYEDGVFKVWYAAGNGWENIGGKKFPQYDINYIESTDGLNFSDNGLKVVSNNIENKEYRIGRPRVYKVKDNYIMNFTYGTTDGRYQAGQAFSSDGHKWTRDDSCIGICTSQTGWDSIHLSYPSVITTMHNKTYMFYNGNHMGLEGFGYAELTEGGR